MVRKLGNKKKNDEGTTKAASASKKGTETAKKGTKSASTATATSKAASSAKKKTSALKSNALKSKTAKLAFVKKKKVDRTRAKTEDTPLAEMSRSTRKSRTSPISAYYALGTLVFGVSGLVLAYQGIRNHWMPSASSLVFSESKESRTPAQEQPATPSPTTTKSPTQTSSDQSLLSDEFQTAHTLSLGERIDYWSRYLEKNLEGRAKVARIGTNHTIEDYAPLFSNEYNCTTYVETVAALAKSQNSDDVISNLISIRYQNGKPGFFTRNHFPEADWIPNNQQSLNLEDITAKVAHTGGVTVQVQKKLIDKAKWFQAHGAGHTRKARELASTLPADWLQPKPVELNYISLMDLTKVIDHIPTGAVINLVHQGDQLHPVLITHQGFVVRENGTVLLRHATVGGRIRSNDLLEYLDKLTRQKNADRNWPIVGVNLNQISPSTSAKSLRSEAM